jgi:hypothetical protein
MMMQRIYVDFNTMTTDPEERVFINTEREPDLAKHLQPGLLVTLYDEEMEVEATVEFEVQNLLWLGRPNWANCRDLPCSIGKDVKSA